jgi:antitoxin MazE
VSNTARTKIVQIGNSQGIRIPKLLLEQAKLTDEVELEVQEHQLIIRSVKRPRQGWAEACRDMAQRGDDRLLDDVSHSLTTFDETEWEW